MGREAFGALGLLKARQKDKLKRERAEEVFGVPPAAKSSLRSVFSSQ